MNSRRRISAAQVKSSDKSVEDLYLFQEMRKRGKDTHVSLLQPISDEIEANGTYALFRMASGKKGPGLETLDESSKNDYDWLKTPPATPLFPSLEMETNVPELIIQRELPILNSTLSRFAVDSGTVKASSHNPTTANPKPKLPVRHVTQSLKQNTSLSERRSIRGAHVINPKTSLSRREGPEKSPSPTSTTATETPQKVSSQNLLSKNKVVQPITKTINRAVLPLVGSKISSLTTEISIPSNLKTDNRSLSAAHRWSYNDQRNVGQKEGSGLKVRRQSCPPSVARGGNVEISEICKTTVQTGRLQRGNRTKVMGSQMLDKFMNSRILSSSGGSQAKENGS